MAYRYTWAVIFAFCLLATATSFPSHLAGERNPFRFVKRLEEERKREVICSEIHNEVCQTNSDCSVEDCTAAGLDYHCVEETVSRNPTIKEKRCTKKDA